MGCEVVGRNVLALAALAMAIYADEINPCVDPSIMHLALSTPVSDAVFTDATTPPPTVLTIASLVPEEANFIDKVGCVLQFHNNLNEPLDIQLVPFEESGRSDDAGGESYPYGAQLRWSLTTYPNGTVTRGPLDPNKSVGPVFSPPDRVAYYPAKNVSAVHVRGTYTGDTKVFAFGGRDHALAGKSKNAPVCIVSISRDQASGFSASFQAMSRGDVIADSGDSIVLGGLPGLPRYAPNYSWQGLLFDHMITSVVMTGSPSMLLNWRLSAGGPPLPACTQEEARGAEEAPASPVVVLGKESGRSLFAGPPALPVELSYGRPHNEFTKGTKDDTALGPCRAVPLYGRFPSGEGGKYFCYVSRVDGSGTITSSYADPVTESLVLCRFPCNSTLFGVGDARVQGVYRGNYTDQDGLTFVGTIPLTSPFESSSEATFKWENHPGGASPYDRGNLSQNANVRVEGGAAAGKGCLISGAPGGPATRGGASSFTPGSIPDVNFGVASDRSYIFAANTDRFGGTSRVQSAPRRNLSVRVFDARPSSPHLGSRRSRSPAARSAAPGEWGTELARSVLPAGAVTPWFAMSSANGGGKVHRVLIEASGPTPGFTPTMHYIERDMSMAAEPACLNVQGRPAIFCGVFTDEMSSDPVVPAPSSGSVATSFGDEAPLPPITCELRSSAGETMTGRSTRTGSCSGFGDSVDLGGWVPAVGPGEAVWTLNAVTLDAVVDADFEGNAAAAPVPVRMTTCSAEAAHGAPREFSTLRIAPFVQGIGVPYRPPPIAPRASSPVPRGASSAFLFNALRRAMRRWGLASASRSVDGGGDDVLLIKRGGGEGAAAAAAAPAAAAAATVTPASNFTAGSTLVVVGYFNTSRPLVARLSGFSCLYNVINVTTPTFRTAHIHVPRDYDCGATADNGAGWVNVSLVDVDHESLLPTPPAFSSFNLAYFVPDAPSPVPSPVPSPTHSPSASPEKSPSASPSASPSVSTSPSPSPIPPASPGPAGDNKGGGGVSGQKIGIIAGASVGGLLVIGAITYLACKPSSTSGGAEHGDNYAPI